MASRVHERQKKIALARNANFATPLTEGGTIEILTYDAGKSILSVDAEISDENFTSSGGLVAERARSFTDSLSNLKTIPFSGLAVRKNLAEHFIAALLKCAEVATTPFQKTITPLADSSSFIDFIDDAGYTWSLVDFVNGTSGELLEHCIIDTLKLSFGFNNTGTGRLAKIEGQWKGFGRQIGLGAADFMVTEQSRENFFNDSSTFTLQVEDVTAAKTFANLDKITFELDINNNVEVLSRGAGGEPTQIKIAPVYTCRVLIPYLADYSSELMTAYTSGDEVRVTLTSTIASGTAGHLSIVARGRITENPTVYENSYAAYNLQIRCEKPSSGNSLQVIIADGEDRNYPAS